jgi:arginine-tRNA-protein transferase
MPIRVSVAAFRPSRSQRRAAHRNRDVTVSMGPLEFSDEKVDLYRRYLHGQHPSSLQGDSAESLRDFLYTSCVDTCEVTYTLPGGRLAAVSILDVSDDSLSSVYHFFDPAEGRRSLGVYSVLAEIEICRERGLSYYYLGYWVEGSRTMHYKANYRPHELLIDGEWVRTE